MGEIEDLIKTSRIKYGILKLPNFMENFYGNVESIKKEGKIFGPVEGKVIFANISTEDAGLAAAKILLNYSQHSSSIYTLTSNSESLEGVA